MGKVTKPIKIDIRLENRIQKFWIEDNRDFSNAVETILLRNFDMLPLIDEKVPLISDLIKEEKTVKFTKCIGVFERDGYDITISKDVFICNKCKRVKYNLIDGDKCNGIPIWKKKPK